MTQCDMCWQQAPFHSFYLAGDLIFLHYQLQLYSDKHCRNTTSLSTALQNDLRHPIITMQLTSRVNGEIPNRTRICKFHVNTSKRTNLQMIPHMHKDMNSVKNYQVDTLPMFTSTKDVFEKQMSQECPVHLSCALTEHSMNASRQQLLAVSGILSCQLISSMSSRHCVCNYLSYLTCQLYLHSSSFARLNPSFARLNPSL